MVYSGVSLWFGDAEETLFKNLGRELVETLITQHMTLYRIDVTKTQSDFYNEAKHKVYKTPVEIKARIQISDSDVVSEGGVRRMSEGDLNAWIYKDHLTELDVSVNVGDFIKYDDKFYEVYDPGYNKDSLNRKFAGDRDYYQEILARSVDIDVFKSIEGS